MAAVKTNGWALEHASDELKGNREIILAAVKNVPVSIQYAGTEINEYESHVCDKDGNEINLSQDPGVLTTSGLFDEQYVTRGYGRRVVM